MVTLFQNSGPEACLQGRRAQSLQLFIVSDRAVAKARHASPLSGIELLYGSGTPDPLDVDTLQPQDVEYLQAMPKEKYQNRIELLQGTLDMLILHTLQWGPQHGYGIGNAIRANSGELLRVETGSLYPALHRLKKQGWVTSEWKLTEAGQRAKYYRLTPQGKRQLASERSRWDQLVGAITGVLNPAGSGG
jgi:transcriptional regulator